MSDYVTSDDFTPEQLDELGAIHAALEDFAERLGFLSERVEALTAEAGE